MSKSTKVTPISDSLETVSLMRAGEPYMVRTLLETAMTLVDRSILEAPAGDLAAMLFAVERLLLELHDNLEEASCHPLERIDE